MAIPVAHLEVTPLTAPGASTYLRQGQGIVSVQRSDFSLDELSWALRKTSFGSPEMSSEQWSWDDVPSYRLTKTIVDDYLRGRFGDYPTFYTEVNFVASSQSNRMLIFPGSSSMILTGSSSQGSLAE